MIISSWPRLVIGTLLLVIGAAIGLMAWAVETCAGGEASSLWTGALALLANLIGWWLLGHRVPSKLVLFVAVLPALAALSYTISTVQMTIGYLSDGRGVCALIKGVKTLEADGREPWFILLWLLVCASFWGGLVPIVTRALRVHAGLSGRE